MRGQTAGPIVLCTNTLGEASRTTSHRRLPKQMVCPSLAALLLAGCGGAQVEPTSLQTLTGKRALFVIYRQFQSHEYGKPRTILEDRGVIVAVASSSLDGVTAFGGGIEAQPDILLGDVRAADL